VNAGSTERKKKVLFVLNDAPYGTEKAYNATRLAMTMQKENLDVDVNIFLLADAVGCALPGQHTLQGYYNIERMLRSIIGKGGKVKACGSCMDARGMQTSSLIEGVEKSSMSELAQWVLSADRVLTF
jgi:uncharacterized protein involved in oxidation of intracellular sulfur